MHKFKKKKQLHIKARNVIHWLKSGYGGSKGSVWTTRKDFLDIQLLITLKGCPLFTSHISRRGNIFSSVRVSVFLCFWSMPGFWLALGIDRGSLEFWKVRHADVHKNGCSLRGLTGAKSWTRDPNFVEPLQKKCSGGKNEPGDPTIRQVNIGLLIGTWRTYQIVLSFLIKRVIGKDQVHTTLNMDV